MKNEKEKRKKMKNEKRKKRKFCIFHVRTSTQLQDIGNVLTCKSILPIILKEQISV